jgi:uncharacterized protein with PIN domain
MIVIDASALIAVMQNEPEADRFLAIIKREDRVLAAAVTMLEAGIVLRARRGPEGLANFMTFIDEAAIEVIPLDVSQVAAALDHFPVSAKVSIRRRGSILATAPPMRSSRLSTYRSCSRATTSPPPTSLRPRETEHRAC